MATKTSWMVRGALALTVAGGLFTSQPARAGEEKVEICHIPPGNPENAHAIYVGAPAVPAHLAHGDFLLDYTSGETCP
jgi:hypothetical protein